MLLIRKKIAIEKEYIYYNEKKWLEEQQGVEAARQLDEFNYVLKYEKGEVRVVRVRKWKM